MLTSSFVYTETIVHSAPEQFIHEAPYQIAIIETEGSRRTVRIRGEAVSIGDAVEFVEIAGGIPYFRKVT
jgi:uncharacterized OB-fold protein